MGPLPPAAERALAQAQSLGFIGDGPLQEQVGHALGFAAALRAGGLEGSPRAFLDLGSGGGLPGLVLAAGWPESAGVLLDANERRCRALLQAVESSGWSGRIRVVHDRAERAAHRPELRSAHDVVVARSFGPPAVVAECAAGFLEVGGLLVVSEPPPLGDDPAPGEVRGADGEGPDRRTGHPGRWPEGPLSELGLSPLRYVPGHAGYQVLVQNALCPGKFPRRVGAPEKRPLYR